MSANNEGSAVTFVPCCDKWGRHEDGLSLQQRLIVRSWVKKHASFMLALRTCIKSSDAYHGAMFSSDWW